MTVNPIRHPVGNARKPRKPEPIARPAALGELLLKRLRDDIVSGVFALGERLSEEQISRHYGITRAPVRPTLIDPTPEEVRELCELRTALELEAARLALRRNHAALADRIAELIVNMEPYAQDVMNPRYQQFDSEFHLAILEAASSNLLLAAYRQTVHWRFAALRFRLAGDRQHAARSFDEHRAILSLIQNTDIDGLQTALRVHIENTNGYYAALIQGHRGTLTIDATNNKS